METMETKPFWKKITVLKSFAVPKLFYPVTVLHNPDKNCINKIKKDNFHFL